MNDIEALDSLSKFLKEKVAAKILLVKPPDVDIPEGGVVEEITPELELVNPAVYEGWTPPKNFLENYGYDVPAIIAMIDNGTDNNNMADLNFRIKIVTYYPGLTKDDGQVIPNAKGYRDLLNMILKIRLAFQENPIIEDTITIEKPIEWNMDEEQNYPYWSANVKFSASIASLHPLIDKYFE